MHDPMTVVYWIKNPFARPDKHGWRPTLITIWHVDPETDGSDDSCDWFGRNMSDAEVNAAFDVRDNEVDNLQAYFKDLHPYDLETILLVQWRNARKFYKARPRWKHPRWHIHHWRLQIHPLQHLRRWLFTRCERCGKRFPYGYSPMSSGNYTPAKGFKGEQGLYHHDCRTPHSEAAQGVSAS
jgi:hypothetical protein